MKIRSGFHALSLQTSIYLNPALRHLTRQGSQTQHSQGRRETGPFAATCVCEPSAGCERPCLPSALAVLRLTGPFAATCVCEPSAGCVASLCLVTSLRRLWALEAPELSALPPFTVRGLELGAAQGRREWAGSDLTSRREAGIVG